MSPTSEPAQSDPGLNMETHLRCDMTEVIEKRAKEKVKRADHNNAFPNREKSSSYQQFQKGKGPSRGHQSRKNQAKTGGHNAVKQKGPSKWRAINSNLFGSSTPLKFGTDFAEISTIGMEFKGFQAGSSKEANSVLVDGKCQVGSDKLKEDDCSEGSEMALDTVVGIGRDEGMDQALHSRTFERKQLDDTSNCPLPEETQSESVMETDALRIAKLGLKRIDPLMRSNRNDFKEGDVSMEAKGLSSEANMHSVKGGEFLNPSN